MTRTTARKQTPPAPGKVAGRGNRPEAFRGGRHGEVSDILAYIADISGELAQLAGSMNETSLAYFLTMARAEAELLGLQRARS